jgi:hypothetical protein
MRKIILVLCFALLLPVSAGAVTLTYYSLQTLAGQHFNHTFTGLPAPAGDGTFTLQVRGDYSHDDANEKLTWNLDAFISGGPVGFSDGTMIGNYTYNDTEWKKVWTIPQVTLANIVANGEAALTIDLGSSVSMFPDNVGTAYVQGVLDYVAPLPGAVWLLGSGLFALLALNRK